MLCQYIGKHYGLRRIISHTRKTNTLYQNSKYVPVKPVGTSTRFFAPTGEIYLISINKYLRF